MKAIQVTLDEPLLRRLDARDETRRTGRSAVIRRALLSYLKQARSEEIDEQIRRGYAKHPLDRELQGWTGESVWPDE